MTSSSFEYIITLSLSPSLSQGWDTDHWSLMGWSPHWWWESPEPGLGQALAPAPVSTARCRPRCWSQSRSSLLWPLGTVVQPPVAFLSSPHTSQGTTVVTRGRRGDTSSHMSSECQSKCKYYVWSGSGLMTLSLWWYSPNPIITHFMQGTDNRRAQPAQQPHSSQ